MQANGLPSPRYAGMGSQQYHGAHPPPSSTYASVPSAGFEDDNYTPRSPRGFPTNAPPSDALLAGYKGAIGEFDGHRARDSRLRASALLNANDPVMMHLLVETALGDSQEYDVLSFDELEALKKEQVQLSSRIDGARRKLALESKLRDATHSLNRLNSTSSKTSPDGRDRFGRGSFRASRSSSGSAKGDMIGKSDGELAASMRKCDEISRDLWQMETRYRQIQTRILRHTAGILQMTHEGPTKIQQLSQSMLPDSMRHGDRPDSPASIYTYENSRLKDLTNGEDGFDERSLYRTPDHLDGLVDPARNGRRGGLHSRVGSIPTVGGAGMEQLATVEKRLAEMNEQLRELVLQSDSDRDNGYASPPKASGDPDLHGGSTLDSQMDYLHRGLEDLRSHGGERNDKANHYETVVTGLWDVIMAGEEEARQRKRQRRQMLAANPNPDDGSDVSPEEDFPLNEQFSINGFSDKVHWLQRRATSLKEQQTILRRQIRQQRQLNSKSDAQKDEEIGGLNDQIFRLKRQLDSARREADLLQRSAGASEELEAEREGRARAEAELRDQIANLEHALDEVRDEARVAGAEQDGKLQEFEELSAALRRAEDDKAVAEQEQHRVEAELRDVEGEMVRLQTEVTVARAELDGAYGTRAQRAAEVAQNPEIKQQVVTLEQEVDGLTAARDRAMERARQLSEELSGTLAEFEGLTKANIEAEKEREKLEGVVDGLRDRCEAAEVQLADEKVRQLGIASPGGSGPGTMPASAASGSGEATKTMVLKDAFKKMMRETRVEHMKALRAEQEERRKLEATIRALRKEQSAGKSSLSTSTS